MLYASCFVEGLAYSDKIAFFWLCVLLCELHTLDVRFREI